ncbi:MAG: ATP-binding protein [Solirubrobacteraceae bacterium]|nr:ATP-binding protein [Solirubrobacteraceae bacterium]
MADASPHLQELRLTRFKSLRDASLPLRDLTLVIGRNGSGKSNVLDGLHVLARLAEGEDVREAIDGNRREGVGVRGGVLGCAPYGESTFALGCTIVDGDRRLLLDVEVRVEPDVQIVREELRRRDADGVETTLLVADDPQPGLVDITGRHHDGAPTPTATASFRSDRLLTAQVPVRVPATTPAAQEVHAAALTVIDVLRAVFVLDPVPALMRQYVPRRDVNLRRQADNISAVIGGLQDDEARWARLRELVRALPEQNVVGIDVEASALDDVMLAIRERFGDRDVPFPARVMSDGMLRFLAFAAALLEAPALDEDVDGPSTQLVIEEIENGLHPSQAARVVELIREESARRRIRTLATTHSPAMLTALRSDDHEGVIVCRRDPVTATTELVRLVDLPRYPDALAAGALGEAVTERRLDGDVDDDRRLRAIDDLLGRL